MVVQVASMEQPPEKWVTCQGNPTNVSDGVTANASLAPLVEQVVQGNAVGNINELCIREPATFRPGELHKNIPAWQAILPEQPSTTQLEVLHWLQDKIPAFDFVRHYNGSYKGQDYGSDCPPCRMFRNNLSCKPFAHFVRTTL